MATYLEGVEDGRRDMLVRIEREAIAEFQDGLAGGWEPGAVTDHGRLKVAVLVNLIRTLSPEPVSFLTVYERVEAEALRRHLNEREEARLAAAKQVSS